MLTSRKLQILQKNDITCTLHVLQSTDRYWISESSTGSSMTSTNSKSSISSLRFSTVQPPCPSRHDESLDPSFGLFQEVYIGLRTQQRVLLRRGPVAYICRDSLHEISRTSSNLRWGTLPKHVLVIFDSQYWIIASIGRHWHGSEYAMCLSTWKELIPTWSRSYNASGLNQSCIFHSWTRSISPLSQ